MTTPTMPAFPQLPPIDLGKIEQVVTGIDAALLPFAGIPQVAFVRTTIVPILELALSVGTQLQGLVSSGQLSQGQGDLLHTFFMSQIGQLGNRMATATPSSMTTDQLHQFISSQFSNLFSLIPKPQA